MTRAKDISKIVTDADLSGTLDVTGDLTVDTNTLHVDSTNNRVGIGTSSPTERLTIAGNMEFSNQGSKIVFAAGNASSNTIRAEDNDGYASAQIAFLGTGSSQSHAITLSTGSSPGSEVMPEHMRITSGGYVGIGTSSPSELLEVNSTGSSAAIEVSAGQASTTTGEAKIVLRSLHSSSGTTYSRSEIASLGVAGGDSDLIFRTTTTSSGPVERMRIDSSGNVGIGTSSIDGKVHIHTASAGSVAANAAADELVLENSGDAGLSILSPNANNSQILLGSPVANAGGIIRWTGDDNAVKIGTNNTGSTLRFHVGGFSEAMRIDSSGRLLVGTTANSPSDTAGINLDGSIDKIHVTRSGGSVAYFNRLTSDGNIVDFVKDGTTVGSIGSISGSYLYIGDTGGVGLGLIATAVRPVTDGANADNIYDLGVPTVRFNDAYITNGVTTGSDFNDKQNIETLSDAEVRVATACKGLLRKWKWKSAVAEKGDNARTHFGIIAQDLQDAFTAEGLDAGDYAMFMSNTWWELDGEIYETEEEAPEGATENTRLGVRYSELLAFIISAI